MCFAVQLLDTRVLFIFLNKNMDKTLLNYEFKTMILGDYLKKKNLWLLFALTFKNVIVSNA